MSKSLPSEETGLPPTARQGSVTVVVPFFNASETLQRALESVAHQTAPILEVLVVDDGSDPRETAEAATIVAAYRNARIISLQFNRGPAAARNVAWDEAAGAWLAFLDSDDAWHPNKIATQLQIEANFPNRYSAIATNRVVVEDFREYCAMGRPVAAQFREIRVQDLLIKNRMSTPSVMVRSNIPFRFNESRRYSEDYELWLTMAGAGHRIALVELPLTALFKSAYGDSGLSADLKQMSAGELQALRDAYSAGAFSFRYLVVAMCWSAAKSVVRVARVVARRSRRRQ